MAARLLQPWRSRTISTAAAAAARSRNLISVDMHTKAEQQEKQLDEYDCKVLEARKRKQFMKEMIKADIRERIKQEKEEYYARKPRTEAEMLRAKIKRMLHFIEMSRQQLKKYTSEEGPRIEPDHDPEMLTNEQIEYYKQMGERYKNFASVGKRGVYGGVVRNMHENWKNHQTVRVDCHSYTKEETRAIAEELATLSGGIVVEILQDKTIIMFRGKNYMPPENYIPSRTLDSRKALLKSRIEQSIETRLFRLKFMFENYKQLKENEELKQQQDARNIGGDELEYDSDPCTESEGEDGEEAIEPDERKLKELKKNRRSFRTHAGTKYRRAQRIRLEHLNRRRGITAPY